MALVLTVALCDPRKLRMLISAGSSSLPSLSSSHMPMRSLRCTMWCVHSVEDVRRRATAGQAAYSAALRRSSSAASVMMCFWVATLRVFRRMQARHFVIVA